MERLQKIIANSGYCSRRKAEELILSGKVKVNGDIVTSLGSKASYSDTIIINGVTLKLEPKDFDEVKPALDLKDVWRKQRLVPFFRGENCSDEVMKAGKAEQRQRAMLDSIVESLPRMPLIFYRALCKLPDLRNKILK